MKQQFVSKASALILGAMISLSLATNAQTTTPGVVPGSTPGSFNPSPIGATNVIANPTPAYVAVSGAAKQTSTNDVMVHIILSNVVNFVVNKNWVNIVYATYADYNTGVNQPEPNQFTISSNAPFHINVRAANNQFSTGSGVGIPVGDVTVTASKGTATPNFNATIGGAAQTFFNNNPTALSTTDQLLMSSGGALNDNMDVLYSTKGAPIKDFAIPAGDYTDLVTYTLVQE